MTTKIKRHKGKIHWYLGLAPLFYGFCPSEKAWHRVLRYNGFKDKGQKKISNIAFPTTSGSILMIRRDGKVKTPFALITIDPSYDVAPVEDVMPIIAHEVVHLKQFMFEVMREHNPGDETEAYFIQRAVAQIFECYKWHRWKGKK